MTSSYGWLAASVALLTAAFATPSHAQISDDVVKMGSHKGTWVFKQVEALLLSFGHDLDTPVEEMEVAVLASLLNGMDEPLRVSSSVGLSDRTVQFEGIIPFILEQAEEGPKAAQKWAAGFTHMVACPEC